jgi:hypothetical protein
MFLETANASMAPELSQGKRRKLSEGCKFSPVYTL